MKWIRWLIGIIIIGAFFIWDLFLLDLPFEIKLINIILFCALFVLFRVIFGPSPADRIVAVDILGILIVGMLALLSTYYEKAYLMDVGLIWALMSFIASLAFAKILEGRFLDD